MSSGRPAPTAALVALAIGCVGTPLRDEDYLAQEPTIRVETIPPVPDLGGDVGLRVRLIRASVRGRARAPDSFAKLGDSISATVNFLAPLGCPSVDLGAFTELQETLRYFSGRWVSGGMGARPCASENPFTRVSIASYISAPTVSAFHIVSECSQPNNTRARCEYHTSSAAYAVIMLGTNDLLTDLRDPLPLALDRFRGRYLSVLDEAIAEGVVPVLCTIPPQTPSDVIRPEMMERVGPYNQVIAALSRRRDLPLINVYGAFLALGAARNHGISEDGSHPSVSPRGGGSFAADALVYGHNLRNLITLQTLDALRRLQ